MTSKRLDLSRGQILGHRRSVGALDTRLRAGGASLRTAAWAGLQDSMPRAALLSIHARVEGTDPDAWAHPALVQVWGPRFSAYVVAAEDRAVFTLGRLPEDAAGLKRAVGTADRLEAYLDGRRMTYSEAGHGMGISPNALRYATTTGRVLIRWDGARRPEIWIVPRPDVEPREARNELARRFLHVLGPGTPTAFSNWAGIKPPRARAAFDDLSSELVPVGTPIGDAWILAGDEAAFRAPEPVRTDAVRLLPSGDTWYLLQGVERELLVPDPVLRGQLWTSRVWPGALLVAGEVVGTWRRAEATVSIQPWRRLTALQRDAVEAEAAALPLPGLAGPIRTRWDT
ncbi:MAG TPA: crosslink repair DNA glycosylase YcaQ family protein [Candidatus Limnocylindrales bacterium]|nr:crosslink repair DNA glycosylase YcaQ family protein [Candidatus Limnocylindrales bacterium]